MKKFKVSALILMSALLFSCSSDDDNSNSPSIVGKWAYIDTVVNGDSEPYDDHEACGKDYIEFKSDNTFITIDVWNCEELPEDYGTYSFDGNSLKINNVPVEISQLSETKLSLKGMEDYDDDGEMDEVILNFERL